MRLDQRTGPHRAIPTVAVHLEQDHIGSYQADIDRIREHGPKIDATIPES